MMLDAVDYLSVGALEEDDEFIEIMIMVCLIAMEDVVEFKEIAMVQVPMGGVG